MTTTTHGPSAKQAQWIDQLRTERVLDSAMENLLVAYDEGKLNTTTAGVLMDKLFAAKTIVVLPSTLTTSGELTATDKQFDLIEKMVDRAPEMEAEAISALVAQGLDRHAAGRVLDYLFSLPDPNVTQTHGFLGQPGDHIAVDGIVQTLRSLPGGQFGPTNLVVVVTDDGHAVKFFSAAKVVWTLAEGQRVAVEATVKAQETYQGNEATVVSRPKITPAP